jgi:RimJ/RimL family protein N-acetyltransferase
MRRARPSLNLNGYTDVPPGKVATIVTFLEMRARPRLKRRPKPPYALEPIKDLARYRALFRAVGEPWLWFSRLLMPDAQLASLLRQPEVEAFALVEQGRDIGLLELDFRNPAECELAFFGLVPDAIGKGAGRFMMDETIRRAFRRPIARFFVHTCSLDHPGALGFYERSGFVAYKRAVEVADDPRLTGRAPLASAPHVPVIAAAPGRRGAPSGR